MSEEPRHDRCETCRFWFDAEGLDFHRGNGMSEPEINNLTGDCRRLAPRNILRDVEWNGNETADMSLAIWPSTRPTDWCGEWQTKGDAVADATILDMHPMAALNLGVRAEKAIQRLGVKTVRQLTECTAADLLSVKNFGRGALVEVESSLRRRGLKLKGE